MSHGGDRIGDDAEDAADAIVLVAQHEDRRTSFVVDSRAQAHNRQDLEASGLERSNSPRGPPRLPRKTRTTTLKPQPANTVLCRRPPAPPTPKEAQPPAGDL